MKKLRIKNLYYITHIQNLTSILERGILSHKIVEQRAISSTPIYDRAIISRRKVKPTPDRNSLWEYANLYFQPRNPMLYSVVRETSLKDIAIVAVKPSALELPGALIADGNAANEPTQFFSVEAGLKVLQQQWKIIQNDWWNEDDGSKRKIMAELLVPEQITRDYIDSIFVANHRIKEQIEGNFDSANIPVIPEPHLFFQPKSSAKIGRNISLIDGDMFFSKMQTLTISVNLQGVMGKGLASRAKYQFPDVYVVYQDACKTKEIAPDKPYLYRREASLDSELADSTLPLETPNSVKWFLLFATKRKWKENSRLEDIESGLNWIRNNYREAGISSLAMQALGCGLGNLSWQEVGPLMCRYLNNIGITVAIYLPREHQISSEYLRADFLLDF